MRNQPGRSGAEGATWRQPCVREIRVHSQMDENTQREDKTREGVEVGEVAVAVVPTSFLLLVHSEVGCNFLPLVHLCDSIGLCLVLE